MISISSCRAILLLSDLPSTLYYMQAQSKSILSQHTIDNVFNAIGDASLNLPINWTPPEGISHARETFVGYLLLDAWIGNSDRHHENWAFISLQEKIYHSTNL